MKLFTQIVLPSAVLLCWASSVQAGGIDLSGQTYGILYKQGRCVEVSLSYFVPELKGSYSGSIPSGDVGRNYFIGKAGLKADMSPNLSHALIFDQPFGGKISYPESTGIIPGTRAELETFSLSYLVKLHLDNDVSIFAGPRLQGLEARANVPIVSDYSVTGRTDYGIGYTIGVGYEISRIKFRTSLAYNSALSHHLDTIETTSLLGTRRSSTSITTPESVNLEFQSGIMPNTMLYGSIRWVEWGDFTIQPADYLLLVGSPLVAFRQNVYTYMLGIGRRFNPLWSAGVFIDYEKSTGGIKPNLSPKDGRKSISLAVSRKYEKLSLTPSIRYLDIGDATTSGAGGVSGQFRGNSIIIGEIKMSYSF